MHNSIHFGKVVFSSFLQCMHPLRLWLKTPLVYFVPSATIELGRGPCPAHCYSGGAGAGERRRLHRGGLRRRFWRAVRTREWNRLERYALGVNSARFPRKGTLLIGSAMRRRGCSTEWHQVSDLNSWVLQSVRTRAM